MVELAGNVLIVDDDRATRELLTTMLSMEGFHAVAAEDGLEALHLLRTVRRRAPDVACLVLLDLAMPIDFEVLLKIVRRYCSLGGIDLRPAADGLPNRRRQNRT